MNTYEYNDQRGCASAGRPRLYLVKGDQAILFAGNNIPGFVAIAAEQYSKSGKWSHTVYQLQLATGVRPLRLQHKMHSYWGAGFNSWGDVFSDLQLPPETAMEIVRDFDSATAKRLDALEEFVLAQEEQGVETEEVVICFGSPTNRQIAGGFWETEKSTTTTTGIEVLLSPGKGQYGPEWLNPVLIAPKGAKVVDVSHRRGMHGGYYTIKVMVPLTEAPETNGKEFETEEAEAVTVEPAVDKTPTTPASLDSLKALAARFSK